MAGEQELKIFVGGLNQETTRSVLDQHFGQYGAVESYVMQDRKTGRSRGFGFVNFRDEQTMNTVLAAEHFVDGVTISVSPYGYDNSRKGGGKGVAAPERKTSAQQSPEVAATGENALKAFVGGLSQDSTRESLNAYFNQFGPVDCYVMQDKQTGRSRGFAFANFEDELTYNVVLQTEEHQIDGVFVSVSPYGYKGGGTPKGAGTPKGGGKGASPGRTGGGNAGAAAGTASQDNGENALKIFVGDLSQDSTKESLNAYFSEFGPVDCYVMKDGQTGRSRGFAFANFQDELTYNLVLQTEEHRIDGVSVSVSPYYQKGGGGSAKPATTGGGNAGAAAETASQDHGRDALKVFVGGVSQDSTKESLDAYFGQFGLVDCYIMMDKQTGRSRGFAFANFQDELTYNFVLQTEEHQIDGVSVSVSPYGYKGGGGTPRGGEKRAHPGDNGKGSGNVGAAPKIPKLPPRDYAVFQQTVEAAPVGNNKLKLFVGSISQDSTKESLDAYFSQFGSVDCYLMKDSRTGRNRGFAFADFQDEFDYQLVLSTPEHQIDGVTVAVSAYEDSNGQGHDSSQQYPEAASPASFGAAPSGDNALKAFVGGLSQDSTRESLNAYFNQFGPVDCYVMQDKQTGRSRGFAFANFEDELTYNAVLNAEEHQIDGVFVSVSPYGYKGGGTPNGGGRGAAPVKTGGGNVGGAVGMTSQDNGENALKIFVGDLSQDSTKESLNSYFSWFGSVDCYVMRDGQTGRSRGFAFVNFQDEAAYNAALQTEEHLIDGVSVSVSPYYQKGGGGGAAPPAKTRGVNGGAAATTASQDTSHQSPEASSAGDALKVFVGGISQDSTKESLNEYFGQFGPVDCYVMMDKQTGRSRGFAFANFQDEVTYNAVLQTEEHQIDGVSVSVSPYGYKGGGTPQGGGRGAQPTRQVQVQPQQPQRAQEQPQLQADEELKLFVGGLSQETTRESLNSYFWQWGYCDAYVMMDGSTGRSRGFAFVNFKDPAVMEAVLQASHQIDGVGVNVKKYGSGKGGSKGGSKGGGRYRSSPY